MGSFASRECGPTTLALRSRGFNHRPTGSPLVQSLMNTREVLDQLRGLLLRLESPRLRILDLCLGSL